MASSKNETTINVVSSGEVNIKTSEETQLRLAIANGMNMKAHLDKAASNAKLEDRERKYAKAASVAYRLTCELMTVYQGLY